jgi:hypothetical protein
VIALGHVRHRSVKPGVDPAAVRPVSPDRVDAGHADAVEADRQRPGDDSIAQLDGVAQREPSRSSSGATPAK